jgi:two-component system, NarL family, response regulator NreC
MRIEIVLVDDHEIFREGVRTLLNQQDEMVVVGEAEDGRAGISLVRELSPQVVILDVGMRSMNGIEACRWMIREQPSLKVIALSMHDSPRVVREMLNAGASGYLLKDCAFAELARAIRVACERNQIYLSPAVSRAVVDGFLDQNRPTEGPGLRELTPREREVVQLIAEGSTSGQIAQVLGVSVKTVEKHRQNITRKLGTSSVAELVKFAVREGMTSL